METKTVTYHVVLKQILNEEFGYISYVFENLEFQDYDYHFLTAIRFPNWNQRHLSIGEVGYVVLQYVQEGIDKWYDKNTKEFQVYNEDNIIFLKFIPEKPEVIPTEIILD